MSVIWKRPDGSQNADPENFRRIQLSSGDKIWVHKDEIHHESAQQSDQREWYPFQLGGDWSREEETRRLNRYVNMLDASDDAWKSTLMHLSSDDMNPEMNENVAANAQNEYKWIETLEEDIKGDKWEVCIIQTALNDIKTRLKKFFNQ